MALLLEMPGGSFMTVCRRRLPDDDPWPTVSLKKPGSGGLGERLVKQYYQEAHGVCVIELSMSLEYGETKIWTIVFDFSGKISVPTVAALVETGKKRVTRYALLRGEAAYRKELNVTIALLGRRPGRMGGNIVATSPMLAAIYAYADDYEAFLEKRTFKRARVV
eukprot:gnl/TRDRNA2_/TRDRNA2_159011_c0_seq2.p1 gnl/TRDRNA2_/TRDRNA2_159011_c0~~gnl/TRDRNA2_/TRDRNA2_159011_c0_seq2.p1  ORF type:complete len:164 (-),score=28.40 gnl/TRDRNA2_/TRDRNA2_159011_c0_seq2:133-624(-)